MITISSNLFRCLSIRVTFRNFRAGIFIQFTKWDFPHSARNFLKIIRINSEVRTTYNRRLNKEFGSRFLEDCVDRQTPDEGLGEKRSRRCDNSNKDDDISPTVDNDNSTSQKFRQILSEHSFCIIYLSFCMKQINVWF